MLKVKRSCPVTCLLTIPTHRAESDLQQCIHWLRGTCAGTSVFSRPGELTLKKRNPTLSKTKTNSVYHNFDKKLITTLSYRRTNQRPEGTVYVLPKVPPSTLQYCLGTPSVYQLNQLGVVKRFVLKTLDNTAKASLKLSAAAMSLPFAFVQDKFTDEGVTIPDPTTWSALKTPSAAEAGFSEQVEPISYEELMAKRTKL